MGGVSCPPPILPPPTLGLAGPLRQGGRDGRKEGALMPAPATLSNFWVADGAPSPNFRAERSFPPAGLNATHAASSLPIGTGRRQGRRSLAGPGVTSPPPHPPLLPQARTARAQGGSAAGGDPQQVAAARLPGEGDGPASKERLDSPSAALQTSGLSLRLKERERSQRPPSQ